LSFLGSDRHGTARVSVSSASGAASVRRSDPFGNPRGGTPSWPGERGFVGGVTDSATGLTHLGAREYDPSLGRFVSVDPLLDTADPQQINGYAYADNSPATLSDPDGLIAARCPDGECRFGGYKKSQSPAARFNVRRKIISSRAGVRCADGAKSCWAARGSYAKPLSKPKPKPPAPRRGWRDRIRDTARGFIDAPGMKQFLQYARPTEGNLLRNATEGADTSSGAYQLGGLLGEAAISAIPVGGPVARPVTKALARVAMLTKGAKVADRAIVGGAGHPRFVASRQGVIDTASPALHKQIDTVADALESTGQPPGVRQGGLPGRPGVFGNREGRLPSQPQGYYTESDVWPGTGPRGTERIVRGNNGEVWYTPDHYGTFRRVR
jgi:RHS repeat-associated protein